MVSRLALWASSVLLIGAQASVGEPATQNPQSSVVLPIPRSEPLPPLPWAIPATPIGDMGGWVTTNDYPIQALRSRASGTTSFRLDVGTDGKVTQCTVTGSSGSPDLDETTCRLVTERAQFSPARDTKGTPMVGRYSNRIRWIIPQGQFSSIQLGPTAKIETYIVETDGRASNCTSTTNGIDTLSKSRTSPCLNGTRFTPFVDATGKAVRKKVTVTFEITITD